VLQPLVLVVEGEPRMRRSLVSALATDGFRSLRVGPRVGMLARGVAYEPDLVLVDVSGPGLDVVALTARLRARTAAPILVALAESDGEQLAVLDAGANDYVVTPYRTVDLLAQVRRWIERATRTTRSPSASMPPAPRFRVDREGQCLVVGGRPIHVTPLELKLMAALSQNSGSAMSEEQLVAAVWGRGAGLHSQKQLRAHLRRLRQKLERDPSRPRRLVTDSEGRYLLKPS